MAPVTFTLGVLGVLGSLSHMALASTGCGLPLPNNLKPGTSTHNVTISSRSVIGTTTQREYILHLPANYSTHKPAPLIFAFHGQQQPAWSMEKISQLSDPAFNKDAIVVYPSGMDVQAPGIQWLGDVQSPNSSVIDDRIFVEEIRTKLLATLCVDEKRLYGTGISNGGSLVALLMCDKETNKHFAALSTVGGAFYPDTTLPEALYQKNCIPDLKGRALPYMNVHGLSDKVVPYDGNSTPPFIPVHTWVDTWVARDNCDKVPTAARREKDTVMDYGWKCGGRQDLVLHRTIDNFGHGWPSRTDFGEPYDSLSGGPTTWDLAPYMLNWFYKWTLP